MKYLKRFLLGLSFLVGLNLLVVIVIWIQALTAVHEARKANAVPEMPQELRPVITAEDLKAPKFWRHMGEHSGLWIDDQHLLIEGTEDKEYREGAPQGIYVIDIKSKNIDLITKNAFILYQNEDGSVHTAINKNGFSSTYVNIYATNNSIQKSRELAEVKYDKQYIYTSKFGSVFRKNNKLFFQNRGKIYEIPINSEKLSRGFDFNQDSKELLINKYNTNSAKRPDGYYTFSINEGVVMHKYNSLIRYYGIDSFAITPSKFGMIYFPVRSGEYYNNNGVFLDENGLKKIWGRINEKRNITEISVSPNSCYVSVAFQGVNLNPNDDGFEIIELCKGVA